MKRRMKAIICLLCIVCIGVCAVAMTGCNDDKDFDHEILQPSDGLSAYEIFCKHYIYIKSEKEWIDELVSGTLERIDNSVLEEKIYWHGNINTDFHEDKVFVIIDKYFYNKQFTIEDFHMVELESVELRYVYMKADEEVGNQLYELTLKNKSKQSVIDAIRKLEIFAFAQMVYPNEIYELA